MSIVRKIVMVILAIAYLFGSGVIPPLMDIWNKEIFVGPFPLFFVGLWIIAGILVLGTLFLYWYERNDKTFED